MSRITDGLQGGNESWEATADELGGALLPGLPVAGATKAVFVLADGPLHRLPFEVLPIGGKGGPLLIQAADVAYESSATLLAERLAAMVADRSASRPSACRLLAFGDPATAGSAASVESGTRGGLPTLRALPHAREEVAHLSRLIEGTCVRVGEQATEAEFFRESPSASVIHLAAHAYVDDRHPGYSGIVLASEGAEDGIVQGFEVLRSDLRADLVTLSACDTGRGRWSRGEGLIGLSRAFRIAGARSLVVSLWQVNDEATSEFMGRFYERLLEGQSLAAALRATKQSFREEAWEGGSDGDVTRGLGRRTRDSTARTPGWWSAFVLLGPGASPYR
ncbi:MAG: hypothetical protein DHS20C21_23410 [Gemmatimonadota bacterium]|nr:MAG: hypothetical protein DHS20C21_23410 [Gemmatimonadota bacterium]